MANIQETLIEDIKKAVYENTNGEITGEGLQEVLTNIVDKTKVTMLENSKHGVIIGPNLYNQDDLDNIGRYAICLGSTNTDAIGDLSVRIIGFSDSINLIKNNDGTYTSTNNMHPYIADYLKQNPYIYKSRYDTSPILIKDIKDIESVNSRKLLVFSCDTDLDIENTYWFKLVAKGEGSVAVSGGSTIGDYSFASGNYSITFGEASFASGYITTAKGRSSTAFGEATSAIGDKSFAIGNQSVANGASSVAEGQVTVADGAMSHSCGNHTEAKGRAEFSQGQYNKSNFVNDGKGSNWGNAGNTLHSVGFGTSEDTRKNAFEIMQNGDIYMYGLGDYDGTNYSTAKSVQEVVKNSSSSSADAGTTCIKLLRKTYDSEQLANQVGNYNKIMEALHSSTIPMPFITIYWNQGNYYNKTHAVTDIEMSSEGWIGLSCNTYDGKYTYKFEESGLLTLLSDQ